MKLHPEYQEMIYPFYAKLYDKYPYNEQDPFNFDDDYKVRPRTVIERHLDVLADMTELAKKNRKDIEEQKQIFESQLNQLVWDLGLKLPSWDNNNKGEDHDKK